MINVITGSNGFSGRYLIEYLLLKKKSSKIIGIDIQQNGNNEAIEYFSLKNFDKFQEYITGLKDEITLYHLGGLIGNHGLPELIETNVYWTSKYLSLCSKIDNFKIFVNIGSAAEYGRQEELVMRENLIPNPVTNYGISKDMQSKLVLHYGKIFNLPVVSTRTFNLIGPGLGDNLVIGKIIKEFKLFSEGKKDVIEMGRIDSKRDFIDIRDAVCIYCDIAESNSFGNIINVATGESLKIEDIISTCKKLYKNNPEIVSNYAPPEGQDLDFQFADTNRMNKFINNMKFIPIEQSIEDMKNSGK